jgi:sulfate adenylyltransferase
MTAAGLVPPHGGQLVNRTAADPARLADELKGLPTLPVSAADLSTVYRVADGTLSPLVGPMNQDAYHRVLDEQVVEANGKKLAWTIPLAFPATLAAAKALEVGKPVALTAPDGSRVARLDVESVYPWPKLKYLRHVYRTDRVDHPGAAMVLNNEQGNDWLVGGTLTVLPQPRNPHFGQYVLGPAETRKLVAEKGWDAVVAFQTRNPLHRAHEYALVYGLETLLRQGKNAGAVLNPLIGETKGDDVDAVIRMQTYERSSSSARWATATATRSCGEGGGSVPDRVLLLGLDIKMFYGGPSEAVMHAIYRQNFGYTHIVIGRKHADAPYPRRHARSGATSTRRRSSRTSTASCRSSR